MLTPDQKIEILRLAISATYSGATGRRSDEKGAPWEETYQKMMDLVDDGKACAVSTKETQQIQRQLGDQEDE